MPRLVVIGDSLAFQGPAGPVPLADDRLYPNVLADALWAGTGQHVETAVVARAGWGMRDVWLALQKDVHLQQQLLIGADAVVLGAGSLDTLPVGVPEALLATLPYLRPMSLRRRVRRGLARAHPTLVRLTAGRMRHTPLEVYRHCWRKTIGALRLFAPDAALCAVLPPLHIGTYYAGDTRHHRPTWTATRELAAELDVPVVDLAALGRPWLHRLNPDGLHWAWEVHHEVGRALAGVLLPQLAARAVAGGPLSRSGSGRNLDAQEVRQVRDGLLGPPVHERRHADGFRGLDVAARSSTNTHCVGSRPRRSAASR